MKNNNINNIKYQFLFIRFTLKRHLSNKSLISEDLLIKCFIKHIFFLIRNGLKIFSILFLKEIMYLINKFRI